MSDDKKRIEDVDEVSEDLIDDLDFFLGEEEI